MATAAVLKQQLISHHNSLIEQLENKYMSHILTLLQQKKCIILKMQKQLYQQFERINNLNDIQLPDFQSNKRSVNVDELSPILCIINDIHSVNHIQSPDTQVNEHSIDVHEKSSTHNINYDMTASNHVQQLSNNQSINESNFETDDKNEKLNGSNHMPLLSEDENANDDNNEIKPTSNDDYESKSKRKKTKDVRKDRLKIQCKQSISMRAYDGRNNQKKRRRGKKYQFEQTKDGRWKCPECDKTFSLRPSCIRHLFIHSGEKPFKCNYCEKAFRRNEEKQNHERTHTKERPYKCKSCGKGFTASSSRSRHRKICKGI